MSSGKMIKPLNLKSINDNDYKRFYLLLIN